MLHVQCPGCQTSAYIDCACPPTAGGHLAGCPAADMDAQVVCPPQSGCCKLDHHHGRTANACAGAHGECPDPDACKLWANTPGDGDCPGGHCHKDLPDCAVCRPLTVTVMPGSVTVQPAIGG